MSFKDNLEKLFQKQNLFLFSILFTLNFYYFKFSLFESINFKIKLPELIYLFLFQIIFFLSLKKIIQKIFYAYLFFRAFTTLFVVNFLISPPNSIISFTNLDEII